MSRRSTIRRTPLDYNLFIDNMADVYPTPEDFASGFLESGTGDPYLATNISYYDISGNDISIRLERDIIVSVGTTPFQATNIVRIEDVDRVWDSISTSQWQFRNCLLLERVILPEVTFTGHSIFSNTPSLITVELGTLDEIKFAMFRNSAVNTFFNETSGSVFFESFAGCTATSIDLPNLTGIQGFTLDGVCRSFKDTTNLTTLNIPSVTTIGDDPAIDRDVFTNINTGCTINFNSSLSTANAGNPHAAVQYCIDRGCTVNFV